MKVILSFNKEVIQKRRKLLNEIEAEATNASTDTSTNEGNGIEDVLKWGSRRPPTAFLDALLTAQVDGELLTDKQIGDEVSTFIFAVSDTRQRYRAFGMFCFGVFYRHCRDMIPQQQASHS